MVDHQSQLRKLSPPLAPSAPFFLGKPTCQKQAVRLVHPFHEISSRNPAISYSHFRTTSQQIFLPLDLFVRASNTAYSCSLWFLSFQFLRWHQCIFSVWNNFCMLKCMFLGESLILQISKCLARRNKLLLCCFLLFLSVCFFKPKAWFASLILLVTNFQAQYSGNWKGSKRKTLSFEISL